MSCACGAKSAADELPPPEFAFAPLESLHLPEHFALPTDDNEPLTPEKLLHHLKQDKQANLRQQRRRVAEAFLITFNHV